MRTFSEKDLDVVLGIALGTVNCVAFLSEKFNLMRGDGIDALAVMALKDAARIIIGNEIPESVLNTLRDSLLEEMADRQRRLRIYSQIKDKVVVLPVGPRVIQ